MLSQERYERILEVLKEKEIVKVKEIMVRLSISESTVRRDLTYLETKGFLKRVHGGAKLNLTQTEEDFETKNVQKQLEKDKIGQFASEFIAERECIFLDAGTTVQALIPYLKNKDVIVITNGISHIGLLGQYGIKTYILEGEIRHKTKAIIGSKALKSIDCYYFDKCFIGTNGISQNGFSTPAIEESEIKKQAIKNSKKSYILADSTKFGKTSISIFAKPEECIVITDDFIDKIDNLVVKEAK